MLAIPSTAQVGTVLYEKEISSNTAMKHPPSLLASLPLALIALLAGTVEAQGPAVDGKTRVPAGRAIRPPPCRTPAVWEPKLVSPLIDADGNYVEDEIDLAPPPDPIDVILALNACPDASDLARFTASTGTLTFVGLTLSVAHVAGISAGDAVLLAQDVRVAFVFLDREMTPFLDTSLAAIRVTASSEYAGTNLEELVDFDGNGASVAVIDTGIDAGHLCFENTNFLGGMDFSVDPPVFTDPEDENGHGTHVAAIIAAEGGPIGLRGVARDASLFDVRVTDAGGTASMSTIQEAIDAIVAHQDQLAIDVLYLGLGCPDCDSAGDDPLSQAANRAFDAGIVVVAPMGNGGARRVPSPAAADKVIAVAALDDMDTVIRTDDAVAPLSNFGPRLDDGDADGDDEQKPDCAAPGIGIASAEFGTPDGVVELSGTSMAAAHVAGLAAFIIQAQPDWTAEEVRNWLLRSCEPLTAANWEATAGHGEIDAYEALLSVKNLGLAGSDAIAASGRVFFRVPEDSQGGIDLNGDGDTTDSGELHTYDAATETLVNLALAGNLQSNSLSEDGELALLPVSELGQGNMDLNGDGDTGDLVFHVFDSGTLTNLGLAAVDVRAATGVLAFRVCESGNAQDLNGDGDLLDQVAFVYDAGSDTVTNLGLAGVVRVTPTMVAIQVVESSQGSTDLNGDGDALDGVMHVYDVGSCALSNLGLASPANTFTASGDIVVFEVDEAAQGSTDLNGDGDATDRVVHAHDLSSGTTTNLGLATIDEYWHVAGRVVALEVSEADQGDTDLNGDGDATDFVIHVRDLDAAGADNLELASLGYSGDPRTDGTEVVAFLVSETFQDETDLNSDDDELDDVLHLYDFQDVLDTELAVYPNGPGELTLLVRDFHVVFRVSEDSQAATDLNGDGDTADLVLHAIDLNDGVTTNLALATPGVARHYTNVYEVEQGSTDLNGDGDATDPVLFAYSSRFRVTFNLGLAPYNGPVTDEPTTCVLVDELHQGNTDLNGDGDTFDKVVFVVRKL